MKIKKIIYKINKNEDGIGIVEVIAALGLSIIVLTSLVSLSLFTIRSSLQSKLLLEGTKMANKELELVRALRDSSTEWEDNSENDGFLDIMQGCTTSSCYMNDNLTVSSGEKEEGSGAETLYRSFTATQTDGSALVDGIQEVRISVDVRWMVGDEEKHTRLYTDLTNWANR